jgi:hypothetical protein
MKLTRRQLFVRGAFAATGLMIGSLVGRYAWFLEASKKTGFSMLTAREVEILRAVLLTCFPGAEGMPPADVDHLLPAIDSFLVHNDPEARTLFRGMLHVIDDHARAFHFQRFVDLSLAARAEELRAWELTTIYYKKAAFRSMKLIIGMHYMEQSDVRHALGWYLGCQPGHLVGGGAGV